MFQLRPEQVASIRRKKLGDALIAATALEHDETLITGNIRHFRPIHGLKLKTFRHAGVQ